jgi:myo-inositol-1(or 4)-monophosphatase
VDNFQKAIVEVQGIRRMGCAAIDICYAAAGRFDGFWELRLKPWDMAAGAIIAKEAGAVITELDGNDWELFSDSILIANPGLHKTLMRLFND